MKKLALLITFLCVVQTIQAQVFVVTTDSTSKAPSTFYSIALEFPFIGIVQIENPSYALQQVTIPFQIPSIKKIKKDSNRFSAPEIDSLVSTRRLELGIEAIFVEADSLEMEG
jgi:hypothetical protein